MQRLPLNRRFGALLVAVVPAGLNAGPAQAATNSLTGAERSDWAGLNRKIRAWGTFTRSDQTTTLSYVRLYVKQSGALKQYEYVGSIS